MANALPAPAMKGLYSLTLRLALGESENPDYKSLGFFYEVDQNIEGAIHKTIRDAVVAALKTRFLTVVNIASFYQTQIAHTPTEPNIAPGNFVSDDLNIQGQRPIPAGESPLPFRDTLRYAKSVRSGRKGRFELRGVLHTGDLVDTKPAKLATPVNGAGGNPEPLALFTTLGADLVAAFAGAKWVIADDELESDDYTREIIGLSLPKLAGKQLRNKRQTAEQARVNAVTRKVNLILSELARAVKADPNYLDNPANAAIVAAKTAELQQQLAQLPVNVQARLLRRKTAQLLLAANKAT